MRRAVVFESERTGYSIDQIRHHMTVSELRGILDEYDDDDVVVLSHDNGYTYGSLGEQSEWVEEEDGDWEKMW